MLVNAFRVTYTKLKVIYLLIFLVELFLLFLLSQTLIRSLGYFFFKIVRSEKIVIQLISLLFLPGVALHELTHFLMAAVLFVPVGEIDLLPKINEENVQLGSVAIGKTDIFRRFLIGIAPIIIGTALIIGVPYYLFTSNLLTKFYIVAVLYLIFEVGNTMFSSKRDLEGALELLIVIALIFWGLHFSGFSFPSFLIQITSSVHFINFLRTINLFLLIPLVLDMVVVTFTKIVIR